MSNTIGEFLQAVKELSETQPTRSIRLTAELADTPNDAPLVSVGGDSSLPASARAGNSRDSEGPRNAKAINVVIDPVELLNHIREYFSVSKGHKK